MGDPTRDAFHVLDQTLQMGLRLEFPLSIVGTYELELTCDREGCDRKQTFVEPTRFVALLNARANGWMITQAEKALCPPHAEERRAGKWRTAL